MLLSNNIETKAMLVHHNRTTSMVSVTSHDVLALDEGRGFTLGAGRAFSAYDKADLASLLLDEDSSSEFLPENRLVNSRTMLVWYRLAHSTPSGHSVHAYPAGISTHIRPLVPRSFGRADVAQRRRASIVSLRC